MSLFTREVESVKDKFLKSAAELFDSTVLQARADGTFRQMEDAVGRGVMTLGAELLSFAFGERCAAVSAQDIRDRGLSADMVSPRMDRNYWVSLTTTLGAVFFPLHAYREQLTSVSSRTHVPSRQLLVPQRRRCQSSELLMEWECRLASDMPFRQAQAAVKFFTRGHATPEDTTIARHMMSAASLVDRHWLFRSPTELATLLDTRATRDTETGRPLLYASTDAHNLRVYVDETWDAQWKSANGIRLWCKDRETGETIHLGGEYTWGNCETVADVFRWLRDTKRLPVDGRFDCGVDYQLVIIADGAPWIRERILPLFPHAVPILDLYHVLEHVAEYAGARHGAGSSGAKRLYRRAQTLLLGQRRKKKQATTRKGHTKRRRKFNPPPSCAQKPPHPVLTAIPGAVDAVLALIGEGEIPAKALEKHDALATYLDSNATRLDYKRWRDRGYQIGSGAMESLHRTASQCRLKLAGLRCLKQTAQAVFNMRLLRLSGRWDEFWAQPRFGQRLAHPPTPAEGNLVTPGS